MPILAVSPESEYANEAKLIVCLLGAGLDRYHLRKPEWGAARCAGLIAEIPCELHRRISIHQHHELAETFEVGLHFKEEVAARASACHVESKLEVDGASRFSSRSVHQLDAIDVHLEGYDYAFLSPVFPSISKPGYWAQWTEAKLRGALVLPRMAQVYALGGITACNVDRALEFGFDGVVLHGSLWQSTDPLAAFEAFRKEAV
ncbi:MAG: thiamine-phosphate pyrophosphorylase [Lentimonas sp.]|jgi:thiamine-phosphate pyrophosphorylase